MDVGTACRSGAENGPIETRAQEIPESRAARARVARPRARCLRCRRPRRTCLCRYISPRPTRTRLVLLTHPREHRKERQGTGRITHLALSDSEILVGVDFSRDPRLAALLADPSLDCRLVYPGPRATNLSRSPFAGDPRRRLVLLLVDATWPCAKKMIKQSRVLHDLPRLSFDADRPSEFHTKHQPHPLCLSTVEAVGKVLRLLDASGHERFDAAAEERLLLPFRSMIAMQQRFAEDPTIERYRGGGGFRPPALRRPSLKHTRRRVLFCG